MPMLSTEQMTQIATALGLSVNPYAGAQPLVMDQDFKNPRATQFGIGGERELVHRHDRSAPSSSTSRPITCSATGR